MNTFAELVKLFSLTFYYTPLIQRSLDNVHSIVSNFNRIRIEETMYQKLFLSSQRYALILSEKIFLLSINLLKSAQNKTFIILPLLQTQKMSLNKFLQPYKLYMLLSSLT